MKIKETLVTEAQAEEVEKLLIQTESFISIDSSDVNRALDGKTGIMYQGQEDLSVGYESFVQNFFKEILAKEQVKNCECILLSIGNIESDPLTMTALDIVNDFLGELPSEVDAMWNVINTNPAEGLTITAICTRSI
ncbi:MAG: hypothetical protein KBT20_10010 [Bacteroidales bacterium]|nr:hypothetical protein [Candidatus Liminaster caballi]